MSEQHTPGQMQLFDDFDAIELEVQAILSRRRAMNASGQDGRDAAFIRAALIAKATGGAS